MKQEFGFPFGMRMNIFIKARKIKYHSIIHGMQVFMLYPKNSIISVTVYSH